MTKCYEDLQFTDDFMFGKVMEDKALCRDVLACLLGHAVGELHDIQTERQFRCTLDGKPIRLDVYARDTDTVYDAEMQNLNHSSVQSLALPKRSRFYQSLMDNDFLEKGNSYRSLPEGRVLFLCTFDPFGQGLPQYIFENRCEGHPALTLRDGALKSYILEPEQVGLKKCSLNELIGGDPKENAAIAMSILNGEKGPKRDAVVLNSAACIYMVRDGITLTDAVKEAEEILDSGRARVQLEKYVALSRE